MLIILLGGNSCTGKTLMAQKLLEKYKISYFSIDNLKMGLYRSNPNCGFNPLDDNVVIAEKLWPIIKEMIKTIIENNQNIIIEGCYLMPQFIKEFNEQYSNQIITVILGFSTDYIEKKFTSDIIKYRNVIEKRDYPEERPIIQFINEHNNYRKECIANDVKFFEIYNDYEEEIKKIYEYIDERIREISSESNG